MCCHFKVLNKYVNHQSCLFREIKLVIFIYIYIYNFTKRNYKEFSVAVDQATLNNTAMNIFYLVFHYKYVKIYHAYIKIHLLEKQNDQKLKCYFLKNLNQSDFMVNIYLENDKGVSKINFSL